MRVTLDIPPLDLLRYYKLAKNPIVKKVISNPAEVAKIICLLALEYDWIEINRVREVLNFVFNELKHGKDKD